MWERFAFYSFTSLFVLFTISMSFSEKDAYMIFGVFSGLAYGLPVVGGIIADKLLGIKRAMVTGAIVLTLGYFSLGLSYSYHAVMLSLSMIAIGNALFKPAPSSLIGMIYDKDAAQTSAAFSMYYMAINIGAFFAGVAAPLIAKYTNFHIAFIVAAIGMLFAILSFFKKFGLYKSLYNEVGSKPLELRNIAFSVLILCLLLLCSFILLNYNEVAFYIIIAITASVLIYLFSSSFSYSDNVTKVKLITGVCLFVQAIFFFIIYAQTFSTLVIFAKNNVVLSIFGFDISPASFTSVSYFWILTLSPILAKLYLYIHEKKYNFNTFDKFATSIFLCAIAFLILYFACITTAGADSKITSLWLVIYYFLASLAELFISAMGLAVAAQYFPREKIGLCMGAWLLCQGCGQTLAGKIAGYISMPSESVSAKDSLIVFTNYFEKFSIVCFIVAIIFTVIAIYIRILSKKKNISFA
ncbi:peptide MFS transporter [Candidatus Francisella endociliophora]|nr:peptide MFS transporter [Francisella sp. FSC1006]